MNEEFKGKRLSVKKYLELKNINPERVLVLINNKLVAEDKIIKKGDKVKIIDFVSKG